MKKQIFILEDDASQTAQDAKTAQPAQSAAQSNEQPQDNKSAEEQKDISASLNSIFTGAYKELTNLRFFKTLEKDCVDYFKSEMTKKIKEDYKHNEKYMQVALAELEKVLKNNPVKTDASTDSATPKQPNEGEEDEWASSKDEWLRMQRDKLKNWF